MELLFDNLNSEFLTIQLIFVTMGRLYALLALAKSQMKEKTPVITMCLRCIENGMRIETFFERSYAMKGIVIYWPEVIHPNRKYIYKQEDQIDEMKIHQTIEFLSAQALSQIHALINKLHHVAYSPLLRLLMELRTELLPCKWNVTKSVKEKVAVYKTNNKVKKAFNGPKKVNIDTSFTPKYSLLDQSPPDFGDSIQQLVPYFSGLSLRETLASDMCLLSLVEYDGLPLNFYYDMAKQAADEIRHALICLQITKELLPLYKESLPKQDKSRCWVNEFERTGKGIPVPIEKNLYEAMWNANLDERLILMHHDTEGPGIARIRNKLTLLKPSFTQVIPLLEIILREEITHARLGNKWLRYLHNNEQSYHAAIKHARILRGILLLTSSAHHRKEPLIKLVNQEIQKGSQTTCANGTSSL